MASASGHKLITVLNDNVFFFCLFLVVLFKFSSLKKIKRYVELVYFLASYSLPKIPNVLTRKL